MRSSRRGFSTCARARIAKYREEDQAIMTEATKKTSGEVFRENCDKAWEIREQLLDDKGRFDIPSIRYYLSLNRTNAQMIAKFLN